MSHSLHTSHMLRHKRIYFSYISVASHHATALIQRHLAKAILHFPSSIQFIWRMQNGPINSWFIPPFHIELSSHGASGAADLNMGKLASSSSSPFIPSPIPSLSPSSTSSPSPDSLALSPVLPSSMSAAKISEANFSPLLLVLQLVYKAFPLPLLGLQWIKLPLKLLPWWLPLPWLLRRVVVVFVVADPFRFSVSRNPSDSKLALLGDCGVAEEPSKSRPFSDDRELSGRWWPWRPLLRRRVMKYKRNAPNTAPPQKKKM